MNPDTILALGVTIAGGFITWLLADSRGKGRAELQAVNIGKMETKIAETERKVIALETGHAVSIQQAGGFEKAIDAMRLDMDKRFNKLESLIVNRPRRGDTNPRGIMPDGDDD